MDVAKLRVAIFWVTLAIVLVSTWALYLWGTSIIGFDLVSFEMLVGLSAFVVGGAFLTTWLSKHLRARRASQM